MKQLPIEPASQELAGTRVPREIDDQVHAWIVERGADGKLEERLDPSFLKMFEEKERLGDDIVEAVFQAAAKKHVAQTRLW